MNLLVSIIIPSYNRASLIGETLESVIAQTYLKWECIVVDDGSNDYILELMEFYCIKDPRIKFYTKPDHLPTGANSSRNYGFQKSKGDYIQWLDSDDLLSFNKIEEQISLLDGNILTLLTCKWTRFSNREKESGFEDLKIYKDFSSSYSFLEALADSFGYLPPHAYLMHRHLILKAGPWLESLLMNQDGEFMVRIISNAKKIKHSEEGIVYYRRSIEGNTSSYDSIKKVEDLINSWKLIESYLKIQYKEDSIYFVTRAKERIFQNLENTYPFLIGKHENFFDVNIHKKTKKQTIFEKLKIKWVQFKKNTQNKMQ
ncbi:glycosyltransferase family 2 protein [Salegentibacter sp. F188]|uniref:Glycosyltransferase family 2 protein n=1 Tax=Autumnicola patrickiae TaxID=3075591 RepID=A0ABU3DY32_9FLAO|nr:glycosyltransferase family 2 protein [Salegentibacter sp. F188]MDT0688607.1 glycosyltransferase family 2 protein [Salegentibacter sp. F188]